jgi:hypothetical protein
LFLIIIGMDVPGDLIEPGLETAVFRVKRMTVTDDAVKQVLRQIFAGSLVEGEFQEEII